MTYTLMNRYTELLDVDFDRGQAEGISNIRVENAHLLPVTVKPKGNMGISRRDFNDWWSNRRIPASRNKINDLIHHLGGISLDELAEKSLGLSLSDQYWIRPSEDVKWDNINFFTNPFSDDIGRLLIAGDWNGGSLVSPDNTSDGVIKKKWKIINNTRCLVKGSTGPPWFAQPIREVFASKIAKVLLEPLGAKKYVVPYHLLEESRELFSVCPNFINTETEYVSFNQINAAFKKQNNVSPYSFCKSFYGDKSYVLDLMLILDYIVLNEDRHFGNFGLIRSVDTGEFIEPAPIFDTGSSLFYDSLGILKSRCKAKPFKIDFDEQIKYVDLNMYQDSIEEVRLSYEEIFWDTFKDSYEDEERLTKIAEVVGYQTERLLKSKDSMTKSSIFAD